MEGNKKEANKKEHCLSASRVFDSALGFLGGKEMNKKDLSAMLLASVFGSVAFAVPVLADGQMKHVQLLNNKR